ncbi:MAG: succinate--CoA ligase subunit beta [Omnitrophica bacterium RIFCSPLOWO2_12_FULL_44_17]|uniref:Succinate--CoA ligase [ADP-forming] subunit beta n=1 Tax=Candidatus Danuiimicrobium aquiferis TaxID=1801832 RepID=A0A1G1L376_9BACT|nr:MAG: succinate--CoA ligase subunit beta [Omnitrophica bacterium RIFCSPHIGHO2_02_FULL_45_28]OGW99329.1 MAG: succinate--CoA ligase subunit beta [Omnitrophica bacterium RIFCSPLOWO2_12_FULL_44_17]OGX02470.1 MAG: succinate--CoA ligase subunit beta [Omnitrophica bacterium RIFCSPLOWO2_02_FULL_44_11]
MKIHEYQAKEILARYGLPVVAGKVADSPETVYQIAKAMGKPVVVKAQVHVGGRGKAGGIQLANTPDEARTAALRLLGQPLKGLIVEKVLVEEQIRVERELYLGITVDRQHKQNVLLLSAEGGVEIEELAVTKPEAIGKLYIDPIKFLSEAEVDALLKQRDIPDIEHLKKIIFQLEKVYRDLDAELAEINPLAWTASHTYNVLDAKINIDDNALFRQPGMAVYREESETDAIEREAHRRKVAYVRLDGEVGIIGNGAGLVMGTMDEVSHAGGRPANFLDIGGGAKADAVKNALEIILMDSQVKGVFLNIFGGITRCDEVAKGIIAASQAIHIQVPIVIRLTGTRAEEGRTLLSGTRLIPVQSMQQGAQKIVELTGGRK